MPTVVEPRVPIYTTAERLALISPEAMIGYDEDTNSYWGFNGLVAGGVPLSGNAGGGASVGGLGSVQYSDGNGNFLGGSALVVAPSSNITSCWHFLTKKSWGIDASFTYTAGAVASLDNLTFAELPETTVLFINPDSGTQSPLPFSGIVAPAAPGFVDGRILIIINSGATKPLLIQSGNPNSATANQFAVGNNFQIKPGQGAAFRYNGTSTKWNCFAFYGLGSSHTHTNSQGEGGQLDASSVFNTGAVPVARGGTNIGSYTAGSLIYCSTAPATLAQLTTTGNGNKVLMVNAAGTAPVYKSQVYSLPVSMFRNEGAAPTNGILASDDRTVIRVPIAITVVSVDAVRLGSGTNVNFNLRHDNNRSVGAGAAKVFTADQTCNSGTGQTFNSGFSSAGIAAGEWFWLDIVSIDNSINAFCITINYTID